MLTALEYVARTGAGFGGGRERVRGLRLSPLPDGQAIGEGPEVRGNPIALLLAASGRPTSPSELNGNGAQVLAARA